MKGTGVGTSLELIQRCWEKQGSLGRYWRYREGSGGRVYNEETVLKRKVNNINYNNYRYLPRKLHSLESGFQGGPASVRIGIWNVDF